MKTVKELNQRIAQLQDQYEVYELYREVCLTNNDHHGVQDASSDLRELESQIAELQWVLEE